MKDLIWFDYVHTTSDSFCAAKKIIPDRTSVRTQERLWQRDFCDGAKMRHADLLRGESHIGKLCVSPPPEKLSGNK